MPDPKPAKAQRFEVGMRVRSKVSGNVGTVRSVADLSKFPSHLRGTGYQTLVHLDGSQGTTRFHDFELEPAPGAKGDEPCTT